MLYSNQLRIELNIPVLAVLNTSGPGGVDFHLFYFPFLYFIWLFVYIV